MRTGQGASLLGVDRSACTPDPGPSTAPDRPGSVASSQVTHVSTPQDLGGPPGRSAIAEAWPLLVGIALLMLGAGLQGSLLGIRGAVEGFGTTTVGVIMSSYYVGYLLGSVVAIRLVAGVGHIRVFAAFASVASSAVLLHALFVEPIGWVVFRMASGFCFAGLFIVAESWLNDSATNETRGSMLSLYMVVVSGGLAAGQLLLNAAPVEGAELFLLTSVIVSLALVPTALSRRANPRLIEPVPISLREVFRIAPLGVVGVGLAGAASGAVFGMGVVYAQLVGLSLPMTSLFMLTTIVAGAALQWPIGRLSDRLDRRRVIAAAAGLAAVGAVLGTLDPTGVALLVTVGLVGAGSFPLYALLNAHTNDWIEAEYMVGAGSKLVLVSGLGAVVGPFAASLAMFGAGPEGFFWFLAVVHASIGVYALYRLTRRAPAAEEDRSHFAVIPANEPSVLTAALVPDAWDEEDHPVFATEEIPAVPD